MGHNICTCLICLWNGCYDCGQCEKHGSGLHNGDCLFFNYLTGGFHYFYHGTIINLRSLYINELGEPWDAKSVDEDYFFEVDMFRKMQ